MILRFIVRKGSFHYRYCLSHCTPLKYLTLIRGRRRENCSIDNPMGSVYVKTDSKKTRPTIYSTLLYRLLAILYIILYIHKPFRFVFSVRAANRYQTFFLAWQMNIKYYHINYFSFVTVFTKVRVYSIQWIDHRHR